MPPIKSPQSTNRFQRANTDPVFRMIGASQGEEGTGKTRFWLQAPDPIYVHLSDPAGLEGVISLAAPGKNVQVVSYDFNPRKFKEGIERKTAALKVWEQFIADFEIALTHAKTILWDKEDFFWELIRNARFGKDSDRPNEYSDLYMEYRSLIYRAFGAGCNFGLIRGMKEKWDQKPKPGDPTKMIGVPSGIFVPRGMKEVPELAQINLVFGWNKDEGYWLEIGKCRQNGELRGTRLNGDMISFATVAQMVFPETSDEDWL